MYARELDRSTRDERYREILRMFIEQFSSRKLPTAKLVNMLITHEERLVELSDTTELIFDEHQQFYSRVLSLCYTSLGTRNSRSGASGVPDTEVAANRLSIPKLLTEVYIRAIGERIKNFRDKRCTIFSVLCPKCREFSRYKSVLEEVILQHLCEPCRMAVNKVSEKTDAAIDADTEKVVKQTAYMIALCEMSDMLEFAGGQKYKDMCVRMTDFSTNMPVAGSGGSSIVKYVSECYFNLGASAMSNDQFLLSNVTTHPLVAYDMNFAMDELNTLTSAQLLYIAEKRRLYVRDEADARFDINRSVLSVEGDFSIVEKTQDYISLCEKVSKFPQPFIPRNDEMLASPVYRGYQMDPCKFHIAAPRSIHVIGSISDDRLEAAKRYFDDLEETERRSIEFYEYLDFFRLRYQDTCWSAKSRSYRGSIHREDNNQIIRLMSTLVRLTWMLDAIVKAGSDVLVVAAFGFSSMHLLDEITDIYTSAIVPYESILPPVYRTMHQNQASMQTNAQAHIVNAMYMPYPEQRMMEFLPVLMYLQFIIETI